MFPIKKQINQHISKLDPPPNAINLSFGEDFKHPFMVFNGDGKNGLGSKNDQHPHLQKHSPLSFEARPVWRKVADLSLRLGQIDQATGVPCSVTMAGNRSNVLDDDGG